MNKPKTLEPRLVGRIYAALARSEAGESDEEIASHYGCSLESLRREFALARNPRYHRTPRRSAARPRIKTPAPPRSPLVRNRDQVIAAYAAGGSTVSIGGMYGVDPSTVYRFLQRCGVKIHPRKQSPLPDHRDQVIRLYQDGETCATIADRYGVSLKSVWAFLNRCGVPTKHHDRLTPQLNQILGWYEAGDSVHTIAQRVGVTYAPLYRFMKRHGVKFRSVGSHAGSKNGRWQGDAPSYGAAHDRVRKLRGTPKLCTDCGTTNPKTLYDWANLTGRYDDPYDYQRLCRRCHKEFDKARRASHVREWAREVERRRAAQREPYSSPASPK